MPDGGLIDLGLVCGFLGSLLLLCLAIGSDIDYHNRKNRDE